MARTGPLDPAASPQWAISGQIVTMDSGTTMLPRGTVWIKDAGIAAITADGDPAPEGFAGVTPVDTGGTLFPGLIDLHNHTAYNILRLWQVPQRYENRDTWGNTADYHRLVTAPMETIGADAELLPALVRYVELKALVGGVTTTQGLPLFSAPGIVRYYRGIVRNVERTDDPDLPEAGARIADIDAVDAQSFLTQIGKRTCFLLHLSEGTNKAAHDHFKALQISSGRWAIAPSLTGIHCVAHKPADFKTLARHGASMVWSPFSNLLLYHQTADLAAATEARGTAGEALKIGLGSDWSPTGSKSLFGELKVARVYGEHAGLGFGDADIVRLATANGAHILGWQDHVGSIEVGKRADLLVIGGQADPAYAALFAGDERNVQLVVINGTPRYGSPRLMLADGPSLEKLKVGGENRVLYLKQDEEDPDVAALGYADARAKLTDALHNIKEIRLAQEAAKVHAGKAAEARASEPPAPRLVLDEFEPTDFTQRPHLPLAGHPTGPLGRATESAAPISSLLGPMVLDALTVADDPDFLDIVAGETNLEPWLKDGLRSLYAS